MRSSRSQMQPFARHWPRGRPSATAVMVAASLAAACVQWGFVLLSHGSETRTEHEVAQWFGLDGSSLHDGHWWQFLSFLLIHPNPLHLLANMLVLFFAGREVEPIIGLRHFTALYLCGNLIGGLAQWGAISLGLAPATPALMGVSAGVAAVLAAYATILPELEVTLLLFFVIPLRVRAKVLGVGTLLLAGLLWVAQTATEVGPAAMVAGCAFGWAYVKRLGFGNPMAIERYLFDRRQHAARIERMPVEQFIREELDPILEKISRQGCRSLTRAERKLLEKGRAKLSAKVPAGRNA